MPDLGDEGGRIGIAPLEHQGPFPAAPVGNLIATGPEQVGLDRKLPGQPIRPRDVQAQLVKAALTSHDDVHAFEMIRTSLAGLYPGTIVTPYLTLGGTDAYKYEAVSPNVYRFMPVLLTEQEQGTIHNENESISLENYGRMIAYFRDLIRNYR